MDRMHIFFFNNSSHSSLAFANNFPDSFFILSLFSVASLLFSGKGYFFHRYNHQCSSVFNTWSALKNMEAKKR